MFSRKSSLKKAQEWREARELDAWHCRSACALECTRVATPPCHSSPGLCLGITHSRVQAQAEESDWSSLGHMPLLCSLGGGRRNIFPLNSCRWRWESALYHYSRNGYCSNLGKRCWCGTAHCPQPLALLVCQLHARSLHSSPSLGFIKLLCGKLLPLFDMEEAENQISHV